jgi:hypothetical protein
MAQAPVLSGMPSGYGESTVVFSGQAASERPPEKLAPPKKVIRDSAQPEAAPSSAPIFDAGPAEPDEPYMVRPVGTWKPSKGYCFYGSADYLYWWTKAQPLPGNLSLSLSSPNSVPELTAQGHNGGRFFVGTWLSARQDLGVEAGYFFLGTVTSNNAQNFPGSAVSNKPIFDGIVSESNLLSSRNSLWGSEVNLRYEWWRTRDAGETSALAAYLDFLGGFRYVDLSENLAINSSTLFGTAPVLLSNAQLTTSDSFGTHNHFFAGQIGAETGIRWGRWSLNGFAKVALGDNQETVIINGTTRVSAPPVLGTFAVPGGFFAQPSNSGRFTRDEFSVLPEAGINLGFKVGDHCRIGVGYTFFYLSNAVRPGAQIDATAGGATRPPLFFLGGTHPQPTFSFSETGFWAQGLSAMLEVSF